MSFTDFWCAQNLVHKNPCQKIGCRLWLRNSCLDIIANEMSPLFTINESLNYYVWRNVRGLSKAPSKTETAH